MELQDTLVAFLELQADFEKLHTFDRVNEEAVNKIYAKIKRLSESNNRDINDQRDKWHQPQLARSVNCLESIERSDKWIACIARLHSHSTDQPMASSSLRLATVFHQNGSGLSVPVAFYRAIRDDDPSLLGDLLKGKIFRNETPTPHIQTLLYALLEFSVVRRSTKSAHFIAAEAFPQNGVTVDHKCLSRIITIVGRSKFGNASSMCVKTSCDEDYEHSISSLLRQMLHQLNVGQIDTLLAKDKFGRTPLHYSALYGLKAICQLLLDCAHRCGIDSSALVLLPDSEGYTPVHHAVIRNQAAVAKILLSALALSKGTSKEIERLTPKRVLSELLLIAIRYQYDDLVHLLGNNSFDIDYRSRHGETVLYVASRTGREDYVTILLESKYRNTSIDLAERLFGWTPLFIACVEGHVEVTRLLLQAGADQAIRDQFSWVAKEHAAFRGHLDLAEMLLPCNNEDSVGGPANPPVKGRAIYKFSFQPRTSHVVVNLGVLQNGKQARAVHLRNYPSYMENRFSIEISLSGEDTYSQSVQLPILSDLVNEPFVFPVNDEREASLIFKLFRAVPTHRGKGILVGIGAAVLNPVDLFGENRESLVRERIVPILGKENMDMIGTVTFTFVIARPFMRSTLPPFPKQVAMEPNGLQIVGHRGMEQVLSIQLASKPVLIRTKVLARMLPVISICN